MIAATMTQALSNDEARWRISLAKDRRFDGAFVTGVHSTGIYCRPSVLPGASAKARECCLLCDACRCRSGGAARLSALLPGCDRAR